MYEIFEKLCTLKGITPYKFCKDTGVNSSTISTWKKNNSQCRPELAEKVCSYFGVSHDYLMTGKEKVFIESQAEVNYALARQNERIKQYMLKFANLSEDKRNAIISIIDSYEKE